MEEKKSATAGTAIGICILAVLAVAIVWSNHEVEQLEHPQHAAPVPPSQPIILTERDRLQQTIMAWPNCKSVHCSGDSVTIDYSMYQRAEDAESEALTAAQSLASIRSKEGLGYAPVSVTIKQYGTNRYSMKYKADSGVSDPTWY